MQGVSPAGIAPGAVLYYKDEEVMCRMSVLETRWHGRGGMGTVTSTELLARAAISQGKYSQSFPSFGPERRGAPVQAFLRISDEPIRIRTNVYEPDIVIIVDPLLMQTQDMTVGLKPGGKILINTTKSFEEMKSKFGNWEIAVVNAKEIALETIKLPITNTALMGAFAKFTGAVDISFIEEQIKERFGSRAGANIEAMKRAIEEVKIG